MNEEQTLVLLAECKDSFRWFIDDRYIRCKLKKVPEMEVDLKYCPITAMCMFKNGKSYISAMYRVAADKINIPTDLANHVAGASDTIHVYKELRKKIIKILGLKGE